jgi:hypothetical protein
MIICIHYLLVTSFALGVKIADSRLEEHFLKDLNIIHG